MMAMEEDEKSESVSRAEKTRDELGTKQHRVYGVFELGTMVADELCAQENEGHKLNSGEED